MDHVNRGNLILFIAAALIGIATAIAQVNHVFDGHLWAAWCLYGLAVFLIAMWVWLSRRNPREIDSGQALMKHSGDATASGGSGGNATGGSVTQHFYGTLAAAAASTPTPVPTPAPKPEPQYNLSVSQVFVRNVLDSRDTIRIVEDAYMYTRPAFLIEVHNEPHDEYQISDVEKVLASLTVKTETSYTLSPLVWLSEYFAETELRTGFPKTVVLVMQKSSDEWVVPMFRHQGGRAIDCTETLTKDKDIGSFDAELKLTIGGKVQKKFLLRWTWESNGWPLIKVLE
ncbi:MAG: hypothetical protein WA252_12175 [Candidatus Sulfotelmatobacter sp.]